MDIFHVHFEVVISCKLLVAKLAFGHRSIGVVSQLVSDQHFLQAEGQITNLRQWRQDKKSSKTSSTYKAPYVTSLRPQPHIPATQNKQVGLRKTNSFRELFKDYYSAWYLSMLYINSATTGTGKSRERFDLQIINIPRCPSYTADFFKIFFYLGCSQGDKTLQAFVNLTSMKYFLSGLQKDISVGSWTNSSRCSVTRRKRWEGGSEDCKNS